MADAKDKDAKGEGEAKPKKGKKGLILILAAVLLLAGGGGAAWWFLKGNKNEDPDVAAEKAAVERKKKEKKARVFLPLEQFTVNLSGEGERFAQVAVILEVTNNEIAEEIKVEMPSVRNKILLLLSAKQPKELLSLEGKETLARQIAEVTSRAIGWDPAPKKKVKPKKKKKKTEDDEDEEDPPPEEAEGKELAKAAKAESVPLPVESVHFSQFIVQ